MQGTPLVSDDIKMDQYGNGLINTRKVIDKTFYQGITTRGGKTAYKKIRVKINPYKDYS